MNKHEDNVHLDTPVDVSEDANTPVSPHPTVHNVAEFLKALGTRRSISSILGASGKTGDNFTVKNCSEALAAFNYKSSFGVISMNTWDKSWAPMMAQKNDGSWVIVSSFEKNDFVKVFDTSSKHNLVEESWADFRSQFSGFVILAKKLTNEELKRNRGHWFFSAFRSSRWLYAQVLIAALVSNFLALTTSIFTMTVYDRIIPNSAIESLYALSVGVVAALFFDFIIKNLRARFIDLASKRADLQVSRKLFNRILDFNASERTQNTGSLAAIVKEFETLREFFTSSTVVILIDLPFIFFFVYVISLIAGPIAYVPLLAVPLVLLVGLIIQPFLARVTDAGASSGRSKQSVLVETYSGLETIKSVGSGSLMRDRYQEALRTQSDTGAKAKGLSQLLINFAASVQQYAQIGIIFWGVFLVRDGEISQGGLIAAVILGGRALAPLGQLANILSRANGARTAYKSLNKLFQNSVTFSQNLSISKAQVDGELEFVNVTYQHDPKSPPALLDFNIKIKAGEKVAIVGKMGSGKSTLVRLLHGALHPTNGSVLIDGIDVRHIDPADIINNVGVSQQDAWLMSGTIRENLQVGFHQYSDEHLINISQIATAHEFIKGLPSGYDTELKEKGGGLSGGQKQALSIARSMIHSPKILIMDEPTSSMDQNNEKLLVTNLKSYLKDKTFVAVTHRNAILTICDRVLVLDQGKLIADTTPEKLGIKTSGSANESK